jgi:hypothetical protein
MAKNAPQRSLYQETLKLLKDNNESLLDIHKEANLPYFWLKKFKAGEIKDPSVNRVQSLYEYLTGKKLKI